MTLPNFLVIGAQKTGTKWLHRMMTLHPHIFVPRGSGGLEVHYWNSRHYKNPGWYRGHFKRMDKVRFRGDITPGYCAIPLERIQAVRELLPDVKIIFTLRNPKERAMSAARMEIRGLTYGGNPRKNKLDPNDTEAILDFCLNDEGFHFGDYPTHLELWRSVFPEGQMLVQPYDLLVQNPKEYLFNIYRFLGANLRWDNKAGTRRIHTTPSYTLPPELYPLLDERYDPVIQRLSSMVSFDISGWLKPVKG